MKKGLTELVFVLDKSGSMCGLEEDTIGGFNSLIEQQKKIDGEVIVSTVLFDDETEVLHDRVNINEIEPMTRKQYHVCGSTALLDAVGRAINHIGYIHKYAEPCDVPEKTIFVITTDGMENASHEFSLQKIRKMINHQQEQYHWEFLFFGANIDAFAAGESYGIAHNRTARYRNDSQGLHEVYCAASSFIGFARKNDDLSALDRQWAEQVDEGAEQKPKRAARKRPGKSDIPFDDDEIIAQAPYSKYTAEELEERKKMLHRFNDDVEIPLTPPTDDEEFELDTIFGDGSISFEELFKNNSDDNNDK